MRVSCCLLGLSTLARGQSATLDLSAVEGAVKIAFTNTPGAAIGIVKPGRLTYAESFGTRNIETGDPVTTETLFRLGSTTKMLTAAAVASLAADGRLDFSDPVGKHIRRLDPAIAALTVTQILSHTSGLKDEAVMNGRHDDAALGEEIRAWKADWLFTKPGSIYSYANPGYWLAGYLAESIAGKPYAQVMGTACFWPGGLVHLTSRMLGNPHAVSSDTATRAVAPGEFSKYVGSYRGARREVVPPAGSNPKQFQRMADSA